MICDCNGRGCSGTNMCYLDEANARLHDIARVILCLTILFFILWL